MERVVLNTLLKPMRLCRLTFTQRGRPSRAAPAFSEKLIHPRSLDDSPILDSRYASFHASTLQGFNALTNHTHFVP